LNLKFLSRTCRDTDYELQIRRTRAPLPKFASYHGDL
jgi:hypothetical protein